MHSSYVRFTRFAIFSFLLIALTLISSSPALAQSSYSVSGLITPAPNASGATVSLKVYNSGWVTIATTKVNANGNYTFTGVAPGSYHVHPSKRNFNFSPSTRSITVSTSNVTGINFNAWPNSYGISGNISGATGVTVKLTGTQSATTVTDANGNYAFGGLVNGPFTVTPSALGVTFSPTSASVTINGANITGLNFSGFRSTTAAYSIAGTIAGGAGATVTLTGAQAATSTADATGNYSFAGLANGTYTVTPSKSGTVMSPASQTVSINNANLTGINFTATATTYSISGTITGGAGATVSLSGAKTATTTANSSGVYSFTGLANGTYTVTPTLSGSTFSPASQSVTINGANSSAINFTANTVTYSISGTITGGAGATVSLSGAKAATTTADASGNYTFTGLANGTYAVTPSLSGFSFSPSSQSASINGANVAGLNFTASSATYSITGTISGGAGATVALSGAKSASTTADASGNYSFTGLANGTYTVTPSKSGLTMSPASQSVTINGSNDTGVNFSATSVTYSISGTITGGAGATVALSGASIANVSADANGNYTFSGLANGTYTVTPSLSGSTFTPANKSVTVSSANVTGINFTGSSSVQHSVDLFWNASPTSTVVGYNVYRSTTSGGPYTKVNSTVVNATTYVDSAVTAGSTYYYVVTAVDASGVESAYSNQTQAVVPTP